MGDEGDPRPATLAKLHQRFQRLDAICGEVGRDQGQLRRAYLVGFSEDRAFESDQSFTELVGSLAELGVSDFMVGMSDVGGRPGLERVARSTQQLKAVLSR